MAEFFYSNTIKNLVISMQTLFNNINIKRYDDNGNVSKTIKVPLKFGPMSKYYMHRTEDGSSKRYYVQTPSMSITMKGFTYSTDRSVSSKEQRSLINPINYDNPSEFLIDMMPSPWDVEFQLDILTQSFQDFCQIVEQIIPFFNPSVYLRVKEFNSVNLERDIRVTLQSMSPEFTEEIDNESRRYVNGSLNLTADAWFYKPITDAKIIKEIKSSYGFMPNLQLEESYTTSAIDTSSTSAYTLSGTMTSGAIYPNTTSGDFAYLNYMTEA